MKARHRLAGVVHEASVELLALAANPRLAPALATLFNHPADPWTLPELAELSNMSFVTVIRHFQKDLGRPVSDLLTDIRMTLAANILKGSRLSTGGVAELAGYQSEAALQRVFKRKMGVTPARWRKAARTVQGRSRRRRAAAPLLSEHVESR